MSGETILVVEDEPLVGLEIKEDLEAQGYLVPDIVSRGEDVVEAVERHGPSLVVMDIRIQGSIDGIEAARLVGRGGRLPIILLTAYSDSGTLDRALGIEPAAFLLKPFDEKELVANVRMALARARGEASDARALENSASLVDVLGLPALVSDSSGAIVHANPLAMALLSGCVGDLRGRSLDELVEAPGSTPGEQAQGPHFLRCQDGTRQAAFVHQEALLRRDGSSFGKLVTFESMSRRERVHLETSVEAINETMTALVPGPGTFLPGFAVGAFLLPCVSGAGDLVQAFPAGGSMSSFLGFDVMGHGTLASLVAYSIHDLIHGLLRADGPAMAPVDFVGLLNERYAAQGGSKPFFTIVYGTLDGSDGSYRFVRAGHPPVLFLSAAGKARRLDTQGGAVGVLKEMELEEHRGVLSARDRLIVASDGYLEAAGGLDLAAAVDFVLGFMEDHHREDLGTFMNSMRGLALGDLPAGALEDDASLLVIERLPSP
jgi:DNA-binding response OmpR family regulator